MASMNSHNLLKKILRSLFIICTGGMFYYNFEIFYRGYSHISMFFCGGLSFYTIGSLNEHPRLHLSFFRQMLLGSFIITGYEFITGLIVNEHLHLHVWDYSDQPFNIKGQVCLPFSILWFFLSPFCIVLDDIIRYALFQRKRPHYKTLDKNS
ncbi:MAG: hypothetical protein Q4D60_11120 [Eubacteriales bacterium]|nr:hypothetical protein [Eubacteriales bacterium]